MTSPEEIVEARRLADLGAELLTASRKVEAEPAAALRGEALTALRSAYRLLPFDDRRRPRVAWQLGNLLGLRYFQESRAAADRTAAIEALTEVVERGDPDPEHQAVARLWLGLLRVFGVFPEGALSALQALSAHLHDGAVVDFDAVQSLLSMSLGPDGPDQAADLVNAFDDFDAAVSDGATPDELRPVVAGMQGLVTMLQSGTNVEAEAPGQSTMVRPRASELLRQAQQAWPGRGRDELTALIALAQLDDGLGLTAEIAMLTDTATELPPRHVMRTLLLNELGLRLARQAELTGTEADIRGIPDVFRQALAEIDERHLLYDHTLRGLAGSLVSRVAFDPSAEGVEEVLAAAEQVTRSRSSTGPEAARDTFLLGMALALLAAGSTEYDRLAAAISRLREAATALTPDDPLAPAVLATLGGVLLDRYQLHGGIEDADAAVYYLARASREAKRRDPDGLSSVNVEAMHAHARVLRAIRHEDPIELATAVRTLRDCVAGLPPGGFGHARAVSALGSGLMAVGVLTPDLTALHEAVALLAEAGVRLETDGADRPGLTARGGVARLVQALLTPDPVEQLHRVNAGIDQIRAALALTGYFPWERGRLLSALGLGYEVRHGLTRDAADLDAAIEHYEAAYLHGAEETGLAASAGILRHLSLAYWRRGGADGFDRLNAIDVGIEELAATVDDVLLQADASAGLLAARAALGRAGQIAAWCWEDGRDELRSRALDALELGRGLVLHTATSASTVADRLLRKGLLELADEWSQLTSAQPSTPAAPWANLGARADDLSVANDLRLLDWQPPNDLRLRVLTALRDEGSLRRPPSLAELSAAVDVAGFDALAYLLPGGPDSAGRAVLVTPSGELDVRELSELRVESAGPVRSYLTASRTVRDATETKRADAQATWRGELDRLCDWAGPTMRDLLDHPSLRKRAVPRLGLIPCGVLGTVPWHAARLTEGAPDFAGQRAFISYAATGRQLVENASRPRARVDGAAVLVGNPGGDLTYTAKAVEGLRDHLYPTASVYGVLLGRSDGLGTPEQILEWMPGSSETSPAVLHLGCHARVERDPSNSHLELARADPADGRSRDHLLSVGRVLRKATGRSPDAAGGLVVLSSCASDVTDGDHDEALTLTTAFLAAGARGVIGSRWVVRDVRTAIFMFVFHTCLRADPADPAAALRTTQAWMLDPVREVPAGMPRALCEELRRTDPGRFDPADIESWAAFAHHGC